jgi:5'-nucleotidase
MLLAALLVAGLASRADSTLLRILSINDFHGALEPRVYGWSNGRLVGGAAALKATLDSAESRCRCPVLRLDGGDEMQGSLASNLVYGRSTIEALSALRLDAAVVGNHELDWGVDTLVARMRDATYAFVAANVFDSTTGRRPAWAVPWRTIEKGGLRIAVVGYMPIRTKQMVGARQGAGLVWRGGAAAIRDALDSAGASKPDLTIIVAHEGGYCDSLPCHGEVVDLARELDSTKVQFIVAGHTHTLMNTVVNGIPIMQARSNGTAFGQADLIRRTDGARTWKVTVETVWADQVTPDAGVEAILGRYRPMVERLATRPVAVLRDSLPRRGDQFALGNLIADAQRAALVGIDFSIMNNGGIRRDLYPGSVTYGDLFELAPFNNNITRVQVTGAVLKQVMERAVQRGSPGFHISGLIVQYDPRKPAGNRVVSMRRLDGTSINSGRTYVLGLSDFLQQGGDGLSMLRVLPDRRTGKTDLDALIAYLQSRPQPVVASPAPRFVSVAP